MKAISAIKCYLCGSTVKIKHGTPVCSSSRCGLIFYPEFTTIQLQDDELLLKIEE